MHTVTDPDNTVKRPVLQWHLVFTKLRGEATAKVNLERQGYRVYYPRVRHSALSRGRWSDTVDSLFPRYLFVQLKVAQQALGPIRSTLGVVSVVRFGIDYAVVPNAVVDGLIDAADSDSGLHHLRARPSFQVGSGVLITSGAFSGLEGIFESMDADERVVVLLNLMGRDTQIRIPSRSIEPSYAA